MPSLGEIAARFGWPEGAICAVEDWAERRDLYDDLKRVGTGGFADVWRVRDRRFDRTLARKVMRYTARDSVQARSRFRAEVEITARLQHPGIAAVHDWGEFDDGRLWFTMTEVQGETLAQVLETARGSERWPTQRLIGLFVRVVDIIAFAHDAGVTHRDLKPENVMVGRFGQVFVMDWGLAQLQSLNDEELSAERSEPVEAPGGEPPSDLRETRWTREGRSLGTPGYTPPEQARGDVAAMGPWSDVFGLGALLHELLTGEPPWRGSGPNALAEAASGRPAPEPTQVPDGGSIPPELAALCVRCLTPDPSGRPQSAEELRGPLAAWLEGAERRDRANAICAEVPELFRQISDVRERVVASEMAARVALDAVRPWDPDEARLEGWRLEDEADSLNLEASALEVDLLKRLHTALQLDADNPRARSFLARHHRAVAEARDRAGDESGAAWAREQLADYDAGEHREYLAGLARVSLDTEPAGATVHAIPLRAWRRRWTEGEPVLLGNTPIRDAALRHGRWVLLIEAADRSPCRLPVLLPRGGRWNHVRPGTSSAASVSLVRTAPSEVYVPAGWFHAGGDDSGIDALPETAVWLDSFVVQRDPVSNAEYLAFLDDLAERGDRDQAETFAPMAPMGSSDRAERVPLFRMGPSGRFEPVDEARDWSMDWPVVLIDFRSALAYAAWRAETDRLPWRLIHELEWEKAARGVDGRHFPWGNHVEASWACLVNHHPGKPRRGSAADFPIDVSPYGVRGLGGNVRDMCGNAFHRSGPRIVDGLPDLSLAGPDHEGFYTVKGGSWTSVPNLARCASRFAGSQGRRLGVVGFRLARSVGP